MSDKQNSDIQVQAHSEAANIAPPPTTIVQNSKGKDYFKILVVVLLALLFLISLVSIFCFRSAEEPAIPLMAFIFLASILGSAVNESSSEHPDLADRSWLDNLVFLSWKLLVSTVFALFLYVAFMSEIVSGPIFPHFQNVKDIPYENLIDFMKHCIPATNADTARMLVWAFIAGYIEKFVPNLIQDIQKEKTLPKDQKK
jgi:hypothetical protein